MADIALFDFYDFVDGMGLTDRQVADLRTAGAAMYNGARDEFAQTLDELIHNPDILNNERLDPLVKAAIPGLKKLTRRQDGSFNGRPDDILRGDII